MEIYVWQAWASNNSGSYTMVGSFDSKETASAVASALQKIAVEHGQWHETDRESAPSPLQRFCRQEGLNDRPDLGTWDDWPEYDEKRHPDIFSVGTQIFVYSSYTVSLVPTFGEYIYKKGGRVRNELIHTHHPLVCELNFWWHWEDKQRDHKCKEFLDLLRNQETVLSTHTGLQHNPLVQQSRSAAFTVYAVFTDLVQGLQALQNLCSQHEVSLGIQIAEALSDANPLLAFEKIASPLWERLFTVTLRSTGNAPHELEDLVMEHSPHTQNLLSIIASGGHSITGVPEVKKDALCQRLRGLGVKFEERLQTAESGR